MRIGVLIPMFNAADTIDETIRSILDQSELPFEICIVDDGSEDESETIVRKYAHNDQEQQVHWKIIHQSNQGLGAARNTGLHIMSSDYVALLDADDTWTPDKLKHVREFIGKNPETDLLYHPIWEWMPEKGRIRKRRDVPLNDAEDIWLRNPITPSACVLRKEAMDWLFETDISVHGVEDALLWTRAYHNGLNIRRMPHVDTRYRIGHGMTRREDEHDQHVVRALNKAIEQGWVSSDTRTAILERRAYYRARNHHKNGDLKTAVEAYSKATGGWKTQLLRLAARLGVRV